MRSHPGMTTRWVREAHCATIRKSRVARVSWWQHSSMSGAKSEEGGREGGRGGGREGGRVGGREGGREGGEEGGREGGREGGEEGGEGGREGGREGGEDDVRGWEDGEDERETVCVHSRVFMRV